MTHKRVPFRWEVVTNDDGIEVLVCTVIGKHGPRQWKITLGPTEFKYDDYARETLISMVELWPAALAVVKRYQEGWIPCLTNVPSNQLWLRGPAYEEHEPMSDLERRVLDLLAPEDSHDSSA